MAASDKNILISPQRGSATQSPSIRFVGDGNDPISIYALDGVPGSLSIEGSAGQLFSITNNLTSGSIFSVNDVSGLPSIDVNASGLVQIAPFGGTLAIGKSTVTSGQTVDIKGNVRIDGNLTITSTTSITNLNADFLDGLNSTQFLRSDIASTFAQLNASGSTNSGRLVSNSTWGMTVQTNDGYIQFGPANTSWAHIYTDRPGFYFNTTNLQANGNAIWHSANDGAGSGLDADLLDGINSESFVRSDADDSVSGKITFTYGDQAVDVQNNATGVAWRGRIVSRNSSLDTSSFIGNYNGRSGVFAHTNALNGWNDLWVNALGVHGQGIVHLPIDTRIHASSSDTYYTNWHSGNDGSGSGLDADLFDGLNSSEFLRSNVSATNSVDLRAPIYYDNNDTAFYVDPNSKSRFSSLSLSDDRTLTYPGILNLGNTGYNYNFLNGSWSTSITAGIMAHCADQWEIAIHDSGTRVVSPFMFDGGTNQRLLMGRDIGWGTMPIEAANSFRAPIFYDSNDTGYYLDAASSTTSLSIAGAIEQGNNHAHPNIEWSASGSSTGMVIFSLPGGAGNYGMIHAVFDYYEYNSPRVATIIIGGHNWGSSWYNIACNVVGFIDKTVRVGFKDGKYCVIFGQAGSSWSYGTIRLRKIHNGSFYDNVMDLGGTYTASQTTTESFTYVSADLREARSSNPIVAPTLSATTSVDAPIYYDRDNTAYYLDPNSTTSLRTVGSWRADSSPWDGEFSGKIQYHGNHWYIQGAAQFIYRNSSGSDVFTVNQSGTATASADFRAPIFYDNNNTAYYTDPASTSNLNSLTINGTLNACASPIVVNRINFRSTSGSSQSDPYCIRWMDENSNGGLSWLEFQLNDDSNEEIRIYGNSCVGYSCAEISGNLYHRFRADGWAWHADYVQGGNSVRGPIFYDSNDTAYYTDPASTSKLNVLNLTGKLGVDNPADYSSTAITGLTSAPIDSYAQYDPSAGTSVVYYPMIHQTALYSSGYRTHTSYGLVKRSNAWDAAHYFAIGGSDSNPTESFFLNHGGSISHTQGFVTIDGSARSPIFYDANNTAYYINPADTSYVNVLQTLGSLTVGNSTSSDIYMTDSDEGTRRIHCNSNRIGFLNEAASWGAYCSDNGDWTTDTISYAGASHRSPIFYDSNNTAYYVDPNSTSYFNLIRGNNWLYLDQNYGHSIVGAYSATRYQGVFAMGDSYKLPADGTTTGNLYGIAWSHPNAGGIAGNLNTHGALILENGTFLAALSGSIRARDDMRTPIFYDSNNTGYYVDAASTSNLNALTAGTTTLGDTRINFASGGGGFNFSASHYSMGKDIANSSWTGPHYADLIIGYHTGIRLGAHYTGIRFYNNSPTTDANNDGNGDGGEGLLMTVGGYVGTANHTDVVVNYNLFANASLRSPILYDSNDTGYYVDPNSTSRINSIYIVGGVAGISNSSSYTEAAIEVRERGFGGAQDDTWATAPRIGFHWGGRVASQIAVGSNGRISILNNPGNAYENFQCNDAYVNSVNLPNGFSISQGGSNYGVFNSWVRLDGTYGFYAPSHNNAHFYPNDASYGAWRINGSRNGWNGIHFDTGSTLMMNSAEVGFHREGIGWQMRWQAGTGYVHKGSTGGGTAAVILDSSNWSSYVSGGATLSNDTTTNATYYPTFSNATSGTYSTAYVSNTKLTFNPSTGTLSATIFTSLSDFTQKKNIQNITNAVELTKQINGVRFDWKETDESSAGVIAQEVEEVLPEIVHTNDEGIKSVNYNGVVGLLIEAIKEQQKQIDDLRSEINNLKKPV